MPGRPRLIVWAEDAHAELVTEALGHVEVDLVAAGCSSPARAGTIDRTLGTEPLHDLRQAAQGDVDLVWIASVQDLEPAQLQPIRARGIRTLFSEAWPRTMSDLTAGRGAAERLELLPLMRASPGFMEASQHLEDFGEVQCVSVCTLCGERQGSLLTRLFDALDVAAALCGEANTVDASLAGVPSRGVPESPAELAGHMSINLRFTDRRCATVLASDRAGGWIRRIEILGAGGTLRIGDHGVERIDREGRMVERRGYEGPTGPGALIGMQIRRVLERRDTPDAPCDAARLLAWSEAARLSCRTGQNESPRSMEEMLRHP